MSVLPGIFSRRVCLSLLCASALGVAAAAGVRESAAAPTLVAVTTCGQMVQDAVGYLTANLNCTGSLANGVNLNNGELDLRGFTLTTGLTYGVECEGNCAVYSTPPGGTITGVGQVGIASGYNVPSSLAVSDVTISGVGLGDSESAGIAPFYETKSLLLTNVTITGIDGYGILGTYQSKKIQLVNSQITNCSGNAIEGGPYSGVKLVDSTISGNSGFATDAYKVDIRTSTITNNGGPVHGTRVKVRNSTVSGSPGYGVSAYRGSVSVRESEITGNNTGIYGDQSSVAVSESNVHHNTYVGVRGYFDKIKVKDSQINTNGVGILGDRTGVSISGAQVQNNAEHGVYVYGSGDNAPSLSVKESLLLGNGTLPACTMGDLCVDIFSSVLPKLVYETGVNECTKSAFGHNFGNNWGVCLLDCRNGTLNAGETCDTSGESTTCDDDCTVVNCQDGNVNEAAGEQCDDGNGNVNDGCTPTCVIEFCGDSTTQPALGETCDDGGVNSATCDLDCSGVSCGDGLRNKVAGEECDDGNAMAGDGCSATCQKE